MNDRATQVKASSKGIGLSRREQLLLLRRFQASDSAALLLVSIVRGHPVYLPAGMSR